MLETLSVPAQTGSQAPEAHFELILWVNGGICTEVFSMSPRRSLVPSLGTPRMGEGSRPGESHRWGRGLVNRQRTPDLPLSPSSLKVALHIFIV